MRLSFKQQAGLLALLLVACIYAFQYAQGIAPTTIMSVSFLDIGQGDAIYIRAPNGADMLVDGGPDAAVLSELAHIMPAFDRSIDIVIATHPDKDHIAGLVPVFEKYAVKKYLHSEVASDSSYDESLAEAAANEPSLEQIEARRGERIVLDETHGIYVDILFPDQDTSRFKETNDASIVARLVYGNQSFLLTGDSPQSVEEWLVKTDGVRLQSSVLKLAHHGSNSASSPEYLKTVHPDYAIVSAGKNNTYHHPSAAVVTRVKDLRIPLLSTIDSGTITFATDGMEIWIK